MWRPRRSYGKITDPYTTLHPLTGDQNEDGVDKSGWILVKSEDIRASARDQQEKAEREKAVQEQLPAEHRQQHRQHQHQQDRNEGPGIDQEVKEKDKMAKRARFAAMFKRDS